MPLSPEALASVRRKKKAKRLIRDQPLFAFELIKAENPGYTEDQFKKDIQKRKSAGKRKGKNPLAKYGRYLEMSRLMAEFENTKDPSVGLAAEKLKERMTRPFIIGRVWKGEGKMRCYQYDATYSLEIIKKLAAAMDEAATYKEYEVKAGIITQNLGYGQ